MPKRVITHPRNHLKAQNWAKMESMHGRKRSNSAIDDNPSLPMKKQRQTIDEENKVGLLENKNFTTCLRFSGMIFLDFLDENELVVVEQPWMEIVKTLPDPVERERYGS